MADFTLEMPRIATVGYPKDLGAILVYGDIFPGARVLEAGTGSGAVTMALLRAVGERGQVISYDLREDMIRRALENISAMIPEHPNLTVKQGDVYQAFQEEDLDRVVLDLPEPWQVVPHAAEKLVPGGILVSFLPTVLQVHELSKALRQQGTFEMIETLEILMRPWSVGGRSVRPEHRMVGHTGFITTARRCSPRPVALPASQEDEQ
jgi:tRNA (adenine57-N1/adenine58-N1)-methyltransferase